MCLYSLKPYEKSNTVIAWKKMWLKPNGTLSSLFIKSTYKVGSTYNAKPLDKLSEGDKYYISITANYNSGFHAVKTRDDARLLKGLRHRRDWAEGCKLVLVKVELSKELRTGAQVLYNGIMVTGYLGQRMKILSIS